MSLYNLIKLHLLVFGLGLSLLAIQSLRQDGLPRSLQALFGVETKTQPLVRRARLSK